MHHALLEPELLKLLPLPRLQEKNSERLSVNPVFFLALGELTTIAQLLLDGRHLYLHTKDRHYCGLGCRI